MNWTQFNQYICKLWKSHKIKQMMRKTVTQQISHSIEVKKSILKDEAIINLIIKASFEVIKAYQTGHKTMLAGNGGSAADAQHIAGEFVSRFYIDRPGLPSLALSTDTSILTAIGNDYGYERLFARQVQAQGVAGDVFIGISTSGNSKNVVEALKTCRELGITTIGFTGEKVGIMDSFCDICIKVPSEETPRIQESHILIGHIICCLVEKEIFGH